jgi:hypothetical protein
MIMFMWFYPQQKIKYLFYFFLAIILLFSFGCSKEDKPKLEYQCKILGHRGSGINNSTFNQGFRENTLPAILNGFRYVSGAEIDIHLSKSGTIWITHDPGVYSRDNELKGYIPSMEDQDIIDVNKLSGDFYYYTKLEDVFFYMKNNFSSKYLSLDIKGDIPSDALNYYGTLDNYFDSLASEISRLAKKYNVYQHLMLETNYSYVLSKAKEIDPALQCYILGYSNIKIGISIALQNKYDGISFCYNDTSVTNANIKFLHSKNLKLQLWTPSAPDDLKAIINMNPDFIQTDNLPYFAEENWEL